MLVLLALLTESLGALRGLLAQAVDARLLLAHYDSDKIAAIFSCLGASEPIDRVGLGLREREIDGYSGRATIRTTSKRCP